MGDCGGSEGGFETTSVQDLCRSPFEAEGSGIGSLEGIGRGNGERKDGGRGKGVG